MYSSAGEDLQALDKWSYTSSDFSWDNQLQLSVVLAVRSKAWLWPLHIYTGAHCDLLLSVH